MHFGRQASRTILTPEIVRRFVENAIPMRVDKVKNINVNEQHSFVLPVKAE